MSERMNFGRRKKRRGNAAARLLTAILIILSVVLALNHSGFFNKTVELDPVSRFYYHQSSSPASDESYSGYGKFLTVSEGNAENNLTNFKEGIPGARTRRTEIIGEGKDKFTVMIYMCGSDSESRFGLASEDIAEMLKAEKSGKLNIIIQTGGALSWESDSINDGECQRFRISNGKMTAISSGSGVNMANYANLTSFILYCKYYYPADRYALILWGNGGGTAGGFGYDEVSDLKDSITIDELNQSLFASGINFDFIGFDSGLTASYETAYVANYYADYLIASQENVPSVGWNYTNWLSAIAENTSIETAEIARIIIDDYIADCTEASDEFTATLSLIDLVDFNNLVIPAVSEFFSKIDSIINDGNYPYIANARAASREFGGSDSDHTDLMELAERIRTDEGDKLINALKNTVKYNRTTENLVNANGLSIFFPFNDLQSTNTVMNIFHRINIPDEYFAAIRKFANISFGGRLFCADGTSNQPETGIPSNVADHFNGKTSEESIGSRYVWVDSEFIRNCSDYFLNNTLTADDFIMDQAVSEQGEVYDVFYLSEDQWDLVSDISVETFVYVSSSDCYASLGTAFPELTFFNSDMLHLLPTGNIACISADGVYFSSEVISRDYSSTVNRITFSTPVIITASASDAEEAIPYPADLHIVMEYNLSLGISEYSIACAELSYDSSDTETHSRTVTLNEGDIITPVYSCYDEDFRRIEPDTALPVSSITYSSSTKVAAVDVSAIENCSVCYTFTDVYGNIFRTMVPLNVIQNNLDMLNN